MGGRVFDSDDSKLSSPPPDAKKPNPSPAEVTKPKDVPTTSPSITESKELNDANNKTSPGDKGKLKVENQTQPKTFDSKSCKGNSICNDQEKTMIACIQDFDNGKTVSPCR
nr:dentin sialophosphoprotein-like isoform X2 [Tanacetum cinerariifolium]